MLEKIFNSISLFKQISQMTLYIRFMLLLLCIALAVTLMQAGSMFLIDYIPSSQSAIDKVHQQSIYWNSQLSSAKAGEKDNVQKTISVLRDHYILDMEHNISGLRVRTDNVQLTKAIQEVIRCQQEFDRLSRSPMNNDDLFKLVDEIISSYQQLSRAIYMDIETKQSIIGLLQLIGLLFVMTCIVMIALEVRRTLINRLGSLNEYVKETLDDHEQSPMVDEFAELERRVYELTARLEGHITEAAWYKKTSERVRQLINAQDFLFKFVEMANDNALSERTLLKMIYSLERAMNFNNVAIIYTDDAAVISTERTIFSHHQAITLTNDMFKELELAGMVKYHEKNVDDVEVCCLCVTFSGSSGGMGILLVEMEKNRFLDDSEIKVLDITAKLLTMVTKFQSNDQEGRRIAILEERAAIARELHDSLAQSLAYMKIQLARLQAKAAKSENNASSLEDLGELREGLDHAYRGLRELLTTFRAHMDLRGLGYAIQSAIDEFSQRSTLTITLDNRLINCRLTVNEEFHILHVVRESLSNIVRHSGANNVSILMLKKQDDAVVLTIDDDGVGFRSADDKHDHYGQAIMKERAYSLGGNIEVMTRRQGGTRVKLEFTPKLAQ